MDVLREDIGNALDAVVTAWRALLVALATVPPDRRKIVLDAAPWSAERREDMLLDLECWSMVSRAALRTLDRMDRITRDNTKTTKEPRPARAPGDDDARTGRGGFGRRA